MISFDIWGKDRPGFWFILTLQLPPLLPDTRSRFQNRLQISARVFNDNLRAKAVKRAVLGPEAAYLDLRHLHPTATSQPEALVGLRPKTLNQLSANFCALMIHQVLLQNFTQRSYSEH